jgi:hypothetical protein
LWEKWGLRKRRRIMGHKIIVGKWIVGKTTNNGRDKLLCFYSELWEKQRIMSDGMNYGKMVIVGKMRNYGREQN